MKITTLFLILCTFDFYSIDNDVIIIRHDVKEEAFIKFAEELPVTEAIVKYNSTDLAGTLISDQWVLSAAHVAETIKDGHKLIDSPESDKVTKLEGISGPGDSSGPAFIQMGETYALAGISSAQSTRATGGVEGLYGVTEYYTRVSSYVDWIEGTIDTYTLENAFDFWVGEWEVSWMAADSTLVKGTNKIIKILDGKVIQEYFTDPSRNFKGTSISVFNPKTQEWHQAWADNQGGYYDFIGELEGDKRIFKTKEKDARGAIYRMVFLDITKDSFIWKWQGIRDGWEDWKTVWEINYTRKK